MAKKKARRQPLRWSLQMNRVFNNEVNFPVMHHESSSVPQTIFGFPYRVVRDEVIETGLADFETGYVDEEYGTLSPQ